MATYWNFRDILDVHPLSEHRCVAINVNGKSRKRCGIVNFMNQGDLAEAETLLDIMDRTESLSECREHLSKLAYLTVCKSPHRRMPEVLTDCQRRWNSKISAYIIFEERKKAQEQKLEKAIKTKNTEEIVTAGLKGQDVMKLTPRTTTNRTVVPGKNMDDPFFNDNAIASSLQLRSEAPIPESPDTSTMRHSLDVLTPDTLDSKRSEVLKDNTKAPSTVQKYGLPTPPSSTSDSRVSKRQETTNTQSPPETPTKLPASTNHIQTGFFGFPLTPPTTETKPPANIGTSECASPSPMFHFDSTSRKFGLQLSPNLSSKKNLEKKTNFEEEFGHKENITNSFRFQLPSPPSSRIESQENFNTYSKKAPEKKTNFEAEFVSRTNMTNIKFELPPSPSSRPRSQENFNTYSKETPEKKTNFEVEFGSSTNTTDFKFEPPSSPSSRPEIQGNTNTKNESETIEKIPLAALNSPSTSNSLGNLVLNKIVDKDQLKVAEASTVLPDLLPPSKTIDKDAASTPIPGVLNASKKLGIQNSSEKESNISAPVEPEPSLEGLNQQKLPVFDSAALEKQYLLPSTSNTKTQSAKTHKLEEATTDDLPVFQFGTDIEAAPPTFDFGTSSKESFLLNMPPTSSEMLDSFISDQERASLVSDSSNIALKTDICQPGSDSTPEDTPETSREETTIPALAKNILPVSSITEAGEDTPGSLKLEDGDENEDESEDEDALEELAKNSPESSETPIISDDHYADLTKTEEMLEPPRFPESSVSSTPGQLPSPVESAPSSYVKTENEEAKEDLASEATPKPPQACERGSHDNLNDTMATKSLSDLARTSEDVVFPPEEHSVAPKTILELPKVNRDRTMIIEEDTTSCEVESELPKPDQKAPIVDEESNTDTKKENEKSTLAETFSTIEDTNLSQVTSKTINESAPTRTESFGHALIDPSERRYTTNFSGHQRQALLKASEIQRASDAFDEDTFSKIELRIEPFTTISSARWSQEDGESTAASENWDNILRENPEWENDRGPPKLGKRRRWRRFVRKTKEGYEIVAEAVQGNARRLSKLYSRAKKGSRMSVGQQLTTQ